VASEPSHSSDGHRDRTVTLISLLRQTARLMVDEITTRLEAAGYPDLPPRFHPVFENIEPEGIRLTVLASRAGLTHQSIGEVVAELEQRGYVERTPDPDDGRARLVRLTDPGRDIVRAAIDAIDGIERDWTRRWRANGLKCDLRGPLERALRDL
jgi:DNA-binding MarR family transcriptional regulator